MENREGKLQWFAFNPADWMTDVSLRRCSLEARGLWIEMLCIMHQGEPYGHLQKNGHPITMQELANMVGLNPRRGASKVKKLTAELEKNGVLSWTKRGQFVGQVGTTLSDKLVPEVVPEVVPTCPVIYSRRMVRDQSKRLINKENGHLGGNPALKNRLTPPLKLEIEIETEKEDVSPQTPQGGALASPNPKPGKSGKRANGTSLRGTGTSPRGLDRKKEADAKIKAIAKLHNQLAPTPEDEIYNPDRDGRISDVLKKKTEVA